MYNHNTTRERLLLTTFEQYASLSVVTSFNINIIMLIQNKFDMTEK